MARFNGNIYRELNEEEKEREVMKALPMIQEIMGKDDFNKMREKYHTKENEGVPFWKYILDNIEIRYTNI